MINVSSGWVQTLAVGQSFVLGKRIKSFGRLFVVNKWLALKKLINFDAYGKQTKPAPS